MTTPDLTADPFPEPAAAGALPRYQEIRHDLERAILSGDWPPGHRVPPEHDLMAQYGCSRMTVNKALSMLAASGMIVRRRRSGSFVATPGSEETVLEIRDIEAEARRAGRSYRFSLLHRQERPATVEDATALTCPPGTPVLALTVRHDEEDRPLLLEERLISLAAVPAARAADFTATPPGSWLLAQIPWTEAEHQIHAVNAAPALADTLKIRKGAACLQVIRRTWQAGETITHVVLTYPGDRHHLVARFNPASGASAAVS